MIRLQIDGQINGSSITSEFYCYAYDQGYRDPIRIAEIASIREYVVKSQRFLRGRVLDFGAGKPGTCKNPQPYRDVIEDGGDYESYDVSDPAPEGKFDAILCTQVLNEVGPKHTLDWFRRLLKWDGHLVMTYPTSWSELDEEDLWRFTKRGMERLMRDCEFEVLDHEKRAEIVVCGFPFQLGYGIVAKRAE